jgi:hypothetical protein
MQLERLLGKFIHRTGVGDGEKPAEEREKP